MPIAFGDAIAEIAPTPGTGAFFLGVAAPASRRFMAALRANGSPIQAGDNVFYAAFAIDSNGNPSGARELGFGTYSSATLLVRTTILESTNGNAVVNFTADVRVELVQLSQDVIAPRLPVFNGAEEPESLADTVRLFARRRAGRANFVSLGFNESARELGVLPGPTAVRGLLAIPNGSLTAWGMNFTLFGSGTTRVPAAGALTSTWIRTSSITNATTPGSAAGWRVATSCLRGNSPGTGGFFFLATFSVPTLGADHRFFVGLNRDINQIGNIDPSTQPNSVAVCLDAADSNMKIFANSASLGTPVSLGTGFSRADASTGIFELRLFARPNDSEIGWSILNRVTGDYQEGVLNSNLPPATQVMGPQVWVNNSASGGFPEISLGTLYLETPI